jgi:hypothetical protein
MSILDRIQARPADIRPTAGSSFIKRAMIHMALADQRGHLTRDRQAPVGHLMAHRQ